MEAVGTIVKVVQEIVKAAETVRQNRKMCLDLADRARTVGDIFREDRDSTTTSRIAGGGGGIRRPALERLKAALDDALELVESQRRFGLGIPKLITSGRTAARFQDVETRITACVVDLGLAEQIAARRRDHRANPEAAPVQEAAQQQGKDVQPSSLHMHGYHQAQSALPPESLLHGGYLAQSAPPPHSLLNQYVELQDKHAQSLLQGYLAQSAQEAKDAQYLMQGYLAQSAQEAKNAQYLMQGYLAQSAQEAKDAQSLMQGYLAQSAQESKDAQSLLQGYLAQSSSPLPQQGQDVQSLLLKGYLSDVINPPVAS